MKRAHSANTEEPSKKLANIDQTPSHDTFLSLRSVTTPVSPPLLKRALTNSDKHGSSNPTYSHTTSPTSLAAVEAGQTKVEDPVQLFFARLTAVSRPLSASPGFSRLTTEDWMGLYLRNQDQAGRHFVIHQHDHPIAGLHYDLRLQFSETSSLSWAIMYGLPGDPNSRRINRNATETRVHCLWNHLIETGSRNTGSMLIWDTGEYEVLPYYAGETGPETDDSASDISNTSTGMPAIQQQSESEKLREAFQNRKIRLRLHGTRLPKNYTIILRLSVKDDNAARVKSSTQKRRQRRHRKVVRTPSTSRSPSSEVIHSLLAPGPGTAPAENSRDEDIDAGHSASESNLESSGDTKTRLANAYPGANNTIGSVYQRRWFITLDRRNSGFVRDEQNKAWVRKIQSSSKQDAVGFEPFYVRGSEFERSVVTGRTGSEILKDENVEGFIPRQGWRPVNS